jgi:hypothetical protein
MRERDRMLKRELMRVKQSKRETKNCMRETEKMCERERMIKKMDVVT